MVDVKEIALLEAKIRKLCDLLDEVGDTTLVLSPKGKIFEATCSHLI